MTKQMPSPGRRHFIQTVAAGAVLQPFALLVNAKANGQEAQPGNEGGASHRVTGDVLRTDGRLLPGGRLLEVQREIPVAGHSNVLVCGGGPAGIGAALAAARAGMSVRLIELAGCLGGVWTAGLLTKILDAENKSGIMREILDDLAQRGSTVARQTSGTVYDPELLKLILEQKCVEAGIKIQLHTSVVGAVTDAKKRVVAVITESKSGRQAWTADRFIDCSGDGDMAAQAGCQFDVGYGEKCECQPMSLMALLTGIDMVGASEFIRENGAAAKSRLLKLMKDAGIDPSYGAPTLRHLHSGIYSIMTNHEYGVPATDAGAITEATIRARAEVFAIVDGLRKLGGPWKDIAVVATAEQIGVREGRRIRGRYTITAEDIVSGLRHQDAICRARFSIDVHNVFEDGTNPPEVEKFRKAGVKPYDVPLQSLIAADVDGLMMAGRCISGDFIAHSSYRVTGNSVPMGEAAGLASAESVKRGVMPHELRWSEITKG